MASIEVYTIQHGLLGQMGVILCCAFVNPGGYIKAEAHVLFRDEAATVFSRTIRFNEKQPDSPAEIDDAFMLSHALDEAQLYLNNYVQALPAGSIKQFQWQQATIVKGDVRTVLHPWIRGALPSLPSVLQVTNSDELRSFLGPVVQATPIHSRGL